MKRREFGSALMATFGVLVSSALSGKFGLALAANLPLITEKDSIAKTLGYCANVLKPGPKCPIRREKERANQFCNNCQLYTKWKGAGANEVGQCLLIGGKYVSGIGWCKSWMQKGIS